MVEINCKIGERANVLWENLVVKGVRIRIR